MAWEVSEAIGSWMIRVSRAAQRRVLGLRVPICELREAGVEKRLLVADRRLAEAQQAVDYWRAEVARIETEVDLAWRKSMRVAEKVESCAGGKPVASLRDGPWLP